MQANKHTYTYKHKLTHMYTHKHGNTYARTQIIVRFMITFKKYEILSAVEGASLPKHIVCSIYFGGMETSTSLRRTSTIYRNIS